jgi:hypothetical protein
MLAHGRAQIVQVHGQRFEVDRVRGPRDNVLDLAGEKLAENHLEAHEKTAPGCEFSALGVQLVRAGNGDGLAACGIFGGKTRSSELKPR